MIIRTKSTRPDAAQGMIQGSVRGRMRLLDLLSSGHHGVQDLASALDITNAA